MFFEHRDLNTAETSAEAVWQSLPERPQEGCLLLTRLRMESWTDESEPVEIQELLHWKGTQLQGCTWKGAEVPEVVQQWVEAAPCTPFRLQPIAARKRAEVLSRDQPLRLKRLDIPKPWGFEGWYTGVEKRGVVQVGTEATRTELPHALSLFRESWLAGAPEQLILLKTLNPVPEEVIGDLYLEMHEEKWEVYVVTEVDPQAWPDGVGIIKAGFHPAPLAAYQKEHGSAGLQRLKDDFREHVQRYESVRRRIDTLLDEEKNRRGLPPNEALDPATVSSLLATVPASLAEEEQALRKQVESFVGDHPVRVGDIVGFPAFNLHSLRHGIRVVEFQTPHYERRIVMFAQKVLTQDHWDTEIALKKMDPAPYEPPPPVLQTEAEGVRVEQFVDFPDFTAHRLTLAPGACWNETLHQQYHLVIPVGGEVLLTGEGFQEKVEALDAHFLPACLEGYTLQNEGPAPVTVLRSAPRPAQP